MSKENIFRFVHIRPPYQIKETDNEKSIGITNDNYSKLLEETEKKTKDGDITFEESRVDAAKEYIFSEDFIIKDVFYISEVNIDKVKKLIKEKRDNSNFGLLNELTNLLPIEPNNPNSIKKQLNLQSSKMWDSYYALSLVPYKKSKELLPKSIFWTKVFNIFRYRDSEEELNKYVGEFDNYSPALDSAFYVNPLLNRTSKPNLKVKSDPLLERKTKIKDLSVEIGELSQLKEKLEDIRKQKENRLQPPIAPYFSMDNKPKQSIYQKKLEKYNNELIDYQSKLQAAKFFNKNDFLKNEKLILGRNRIAVENISKTDIEKKIDIKISALIGELNNLSFMERVTIKNGRFVKTLKRIQP